MRHSLAHVSNFSPSEIPYRTAWHSQAEMPQVVFGNRVLWG
jgi:hypothetical protein